MSDIPAAREILERLKNEIFLAIRTVNSLEVMARLDEALDLMKRHRVKRTAPSRRRALTEDQKQAVRDWIAEAPLTPIDTIARHYDVANGRISEALRGR